MQKNLVDFSVLFYRKLRYVLRSISIPTSGTHVDAKERVHTEEDLLIHTNKIDNFLLKGK